MRAARGRMLAGAIAALTIALGGCSAPSTAPSTAPTSSSAAPTPTPTPEAVVVDLSAEPISGVGPTEQHPGVAFPAPEGARSVTLDVECTGGERFVIGITTAMSLDTARLERTCTGVQSMIWPVSKSAAPTLYIWAPDGVAWTVTPRFSADEFETDETIAAECAAFGEIYSAVMNADQGYGTYQAFGLDEWTARVDAAAADLDRLAASSETSMAPGFARMLELMRSPDRVPGEISKGVILNDLIGDACAVNHTVMVLNAEFGG
ncbi:hypothetical protein [Microbacterium sp. UFMG61]|uniref:hypothetical protein n=1 Tax=Microbacterium sp. UFMG61 TaxID=2745935 RepID=UPI0018901D04|nr:hypothetical protein [Microbacterium sp. UFMG61]